MTDNSVFRILLVEDDQSFSRAIVTLLQHEHLITAVGTGKDARSLLGKETFNLLILDLTLPDDDGLRLCSWIRGDSRHHEMPIMLLTGRDEVEDKVMAFSLGADDYLVKPVDPREFKARIQAKLEQQRQKSHSEHVFCIGNLKFVIPRQQLLIVDGNHAEPVEVTPRELRLLLFLARKEGRIFSRDELMSAVWGGDVHVLDRTVDSHLSALRKKLGSASHEIKAVRGEGYQLVRKDGTTIKKAA